MPVDADAMAQMADMVVLAIKTALAPVVARTQALEAEVATLRGTVTDPAIEQARAAMLARVDALEVKAAEPLPVVDLDAAVAPIVERMATIEGSLARLSYLDERVKAIETAEPPPAPEPVAVDLTEAIKPMQERIAAFEERIAPVESRVLTVDQIVTELRDHLTAVETKAAAPPAPPVEPEDRLIDIRARISNLETKVQTDTTPRDITSLCERVAVLETRAPVPGPPGEPGANGQDGKDGRDGKDGVDGLGFDDIGVSFDDDRTITLAFAKGEQRKTFPIVLPYSKYQGIFHEGNEYACGDVVTWGGSQWHCNETTRTKPGEMAKAWTLAVKRGRDGKDGRDAPGALPVVTVGRPR